MWEILTRERPFKDFNNFQIISLIGMDGKTAELLQLPEGVEPLWRACAPACWHADPKRRPSFAQIYDVCRSAFGEVVEGTAVLARGEHEGKDAGMAAWQRLFGG